MAFQLWSESNPESKIELIPDFGFRHWNSLTSEDKYKIWQYLSFDFFDRKPFYDRSNLLADKNGKYYRFYGDPSIEQKRRNRIVNCIRQLNYFYKAKSYAYDFLEESTLTNACSDFFRIFTKESQEVVLELLSLYANEIILEGKDSYNELPVKEDESYKQRKSQWEWAHFRVFAASLNDVFSQFGINLLLTEVGFVPRQDEKITEEIYAPVLKILSHIKYKEVNELLSESFQEFRKNTPEGYSTCVTKAVSSVQAFLQIKVFGKIGKGDISKLIHEAQLKNIVPSDLFTKEIFKTIESFLAKERQETGDAHPRKEFSNEKNALLVLNTAIVFFQHCL